MLGRLVGGWTSAVGGGVYTGDNSSLSFGAADAARRNPHSFSEPWAGPSHSEQLVAQAAASQSTMTPHPFSQGEVLYIRHCAGCHGWEGKGNGPVGQVLVKKPPSLRRPELFT